MVKSAFKNVKTVVSFGLEHPNSSVRDREGNMSVKASMRSMLLIVPALALVVPAFAQSRPPRLSDSQEPGSVIVFPKFNNTEGVFPPTGGLFPASALKIGVVCPKGATCSSDQPVTISFHWVCPPSVPSVSTTCPETDFVVTATVFEKIILVPDGSREDFYQTGLPTKSVPAAPCAGGYLIGWVVDNNNTAQPIKFDGLIGSADLRDATHGTNATALGTYSAIPIQANPALATGAAITTNSNGGLVFDGGTGHYQAVTGRVFGNARYTRQTQITPELAFGTQTFLTLLTLDVMSNRPNPATFVDLDFFGGNPSAIGNENQLSTFTDFICWEEVAVDAINSNLTTTLMGLEGVFASATAQKPSGAAATLLGLVKTLETETDTLPGIPTFTLIHQEAIDALSNDSVPVPTIFVPH
jgi:hypothetical protein